MKLIHPTTKKDILTVVEQALELPGGPGLPAWDGYMMDGLPAEIYEDGHHVRTPSDYELVALLQLYWGEWLAERGYQIHCSEIFGVGMHYSFDMKTYHKTIIEAQAAAIGAMI